MSEWITVKDDDIEVDVYSKEVDIPLYPDDAGNIWLSLTFKQIQKIYERINK
jgi:hypothetical protein